MKNIRIKNLIFNILVLFFVMLIFNNSFCNEILVKDYLKEKTFDFIYKNEKDYLLDIINYEISIDEKYKEYLPVRPESLWEYNTMEYFKYLKLKKNNEVLKNQLVYFNGCIYGTDENGYLVLSGLFNYKDKKYLIHKDIGVRLDEQECLVENEGVKYYLDENSNVYEGEKLFIKYKGKEYFFNDKHEFIEEKDAFSIEERNGEKYIKNYDKYNLDFYVVDGKGYFIEKDGKVKKFEEYNHKFLEYNVKNEKGVEETRHRFFAEDGFYVNSIRLIKIFYSKYNEYPIAFDKEGYVVKNKIYKVIDYRMYDEVGLEVKPEEGVVYYNDKAYYNKASYGDFLKYAIYGDYNRGFYFAKKNLELVKNKTIANIFEFGPDYKLIGSENMSNMGIASYVRYFNKFIKYYYIITGKEI